MLCVLLIDDNDRFRDILAEYRRSFGLPVKAMESWSSAWELIELGMVDVIVSDAILTSGHALHEIGSLRRRFPEVSVIILTGFGDPDSLLSLDEEVMLSECKVVRKGAELDEIYHLILKSSARVKALLGFFFCPQGESIYGTSLQDNSMGYKQVRKRSRSGIGRGSS